MWTRSGWLPQIHLAQQAAKMISPQSIAIAVSATRMDGQGSVIMSGTLKYCFAYIVILGLKVGLVYHLFMA